MRCVIMQKRAALYYLSYQFVKYPFLLEINEGNDLVRNTKGEALVPIFLFAVRLSDTLHVICYSLS